MTADHWGKGRVVGTGQTYTGKSAASPDSSALTRAAVQAQEQEQENPMTADNEAREQALSAEIEKWRFDIDQPLQIRAVAKSWFRSGYDAALASRPAVPAAIGELIAEARKASTAVYLATDAVVADDLSSILRGLADALEALRAQTAKSVDSPQHKD